MRPHRSSLSILVVVTLVVVSAAAPLAAAETPLRITNADLPRVSKVSVIGPQPGTVADDSWIAAVDAELRELEAGRQIAPAESTSASEELCITIARGVRVARDSFGLRPACIYGRCAGPYNRARPIFGRLYTRF